MFALSIMADCRAFCKAEGGGIGVVHLIHDNLFASVSEHLADRRVEPRFPAGRSAVLPPIDLPEGECVSEKSSPTAPLMLFLVYRDAEGRHSERRVTVRQLQGNPPHIMVCFCHERGALRNFRIDRVIEAVHPETGEVFVGAGITEALSEAGYRPVDPFFKRLVTILVFVMRCDGRADLEEWEIIDDAIANWAGRFDGGRSAAAAQLLARRIAPDSGDMLTALNALALGADRVAAARFLSRAVQRLIGVDGIETAEEFQWSVELHAALQRIAG